MAEDIDLGEEVDVDILVLLDVDKLVELAAIGIGYSEVVTVDVETREEVLELVGVLELGVGDR